MKKFFKWFTIVLGALIVIGVVGFQLMKYNTKRHSPAATAQYAANGNSISVDYCRPYKKERDIFGGLVPYGEVWRTGANEATTFVTNSDLSIQGKTLSAGEYTLWTIPKENEWEIIINSGEYGWGVSFEGKASREPKFDVISATVPVQKTEEPFEQFTIVLEEGKEHDVEMELKWDLTLVELPIDWAE